MAFSVPETDAVRIYQIEYTDTAKEEIERAYLWRSISVSPEAAARWAEQLRAKVDTLAAFPYRNEPAPEYARAGANVRRLLFGAYRVLYLVIEQEQEHTEGVIRILHIYHGAQQSVHSEGLSDDE